jgi:hypothetical protein
VGFWRRRGFSRCSHLHRRQHHGGPDLSRERPRVGERAGTAAPLGIVHVLSHSRHRQYDLTVTLVARVSTALPWQKGQIAGRASSSAERESGIVMVSSAAVLNEASSTAYQSRRAIVSSSRGARRTVVQGAAFVQLVV